MANYNYNLLFYFDSKVKYRLDLLTDSLIAGFFMSAIEVVQGMIRRCCC